MDEFSERRFKVGDLVTVDRIDRPDPFYAGIWRVTGIGDKTYPELVDCCKIDEFGVSTQETISVPYWRLFLAEGFRRP
jgi:hypothetical protein